MQTEFRNRAFLPLVIPLAILAVIGVLGGLFALILLYSTREVAVAVAIDGAAGILVAISLAASRDRLEAPQKGAVGIAAGTPLVVGVLLATGLVGGIDDADRQINVEPHGPVFIFDGIVPGEDGEEPPVLAADDLDSFCLPSGGGCEDTNEWSFEYDPASGEIDYAFDNIDDVEHNLFLYALPPEELDGLSEAISLNTLEGEYSETVITPEPPPNVDGGGAQTYRWAPPGEDAEEGATPIPEQAYFVCTIHSSTMWGVVSIDAA